jgi:lysophospholipid acyltransferase (LPLAT)-like uncharacterized protein
MTNTSSNSTMPTGPSRRRMSKGRRLAYALAAPVINGLARLFWRTCRIERVLGQEHANAALGAGKPVIPCYWHQRQFICVRYAIGLQERGIKIGFLVSPSVDGELASRLIRGWGAYSIRGSSTRTGAQAMRDLYQAIARDGISPVTTPDGPTGPARKFKSGTVMLARLSGAPMLPISYAAEKAWHLRTWDRFVIPHPFTHIAIAIGKPRYVDRGLPASALEMIRQEMEDALNDLGRKAAEALAYDLQRV